MKGRTRVAVLLWVAGLMLLQVCLAGSVGLAAAKVHWGEVRTAAYDGLLDEILTYRNELYAGGYVLADQTTTNKKSEADFVINIYGEMGAAGILELEEELEDSTEVEAEPDFATGMKLRIGGVYLISLHDASYAKLRIDRMTSSRVVFSYVLEAAAPAAPDSGPQAQAPAKEITLEEGGVTLRWEAAPGEAGWDLYRSDNGNDYTLMNDFELKEPIYTDNYAIAGHTYLYKYISFDARGNQVAESSVYQLNVVAKGTLSGNAGGSDDGETVIVMQLDNTIATINGKPFRLEVAPTLLNSTTMVPVRFVTEALGAEVVWNGDERTISITLGSDIVILRVDQVEAQVNGDTVYMTVPAQIVEGTTLVPVRFVSENLKKTVSFNDETREITITGSRNAPEDISGEPEPGEEDLPADEPGVDDRDYSFYYHIWQLAIPGVSYEILDQVVTSVGALSGGLLIQDDGTYYWNSTWDDRLIEGTWEPNSDPAYPIRLLDAQEGQDWLVGQTNDGEGIYVWNGGSIHYVGQAVD